MPFAPVQETKANTETERQAERHRDREVTDAKRQRKSEKVVGRQKDAETDREAE